MWGEPERVPKQHLYVYMSVHTADISGIVLLVRLVSLVEQDVPFSSADLSLNSDAVFVQYDLPQTILEQPEYMCTALFSQVAMHTLNLHVTQCSLVLFAEECIHVTHTHSHVTNKLVQFLPA